MALRYGLTIELLTQGHYAPDGLRGEPPHCTDGTGAGLFCSGRL